MSWYSFGREFSTSWNTHNKIESFVSGEVIADYIFSNHVAPSSAYKNIKLTASEQIAEQAKRHFSPSSRGIATRILKRHLSYHMLSSVIQKISLELSSLAYDALTAKLGFSARLVSIEPEKASAWPAPEAKEIPSNSPLIGPAKKDWQTLSPADELQVEKISSPKELAPSRLEKLQNYLNRNYNQSDSLELKALLADWRIKEFVLLSIRLSLRPVCERALIDAASSASKTSTHIGIDLASKKTLSVITLPFLSYLFSTAAAWTSYCVQDHIDSSYADMSSNAINYLPSTSTILAVSAVYHFAQAGYIWHSTYNGTTPHNGDKRHIRELAMQLVHKRLAGKIQNNPVTKKIGLQLSQTSVEKMAANLIDEAIDNHWQTLCQTHMLGMPLVKD